MKRIMLLLFVGILMISSVSAIGWTNESLVAYYGLEQVAGNVVDSTGQGHVGVNYGAYRGIAGKINNAFNFTSADTDGINITSLDVELNDEFTINMWIKTKSPADNQQLWHTQDVDNDGGVKDEVKLFIIGGDFEFRTKTGAGESQVDSGIGAVVDEWIMVTAIHNSTHNLLYLNNSFVGKALDTGDCVFDNIDYTTIGEWVVDGLFPFDGAIDEVGLWNTTLTTQNISDLWNGGVGIGFGGAGGNVATATLYSPTDKTIITDFGTNFTIYYNATNFNFTNTTYYIWNTTGVFNNSVFVSITGEDNLTKEYIDDFSLGSYQWGCYFCYENTTNNYCNWSLNYTFEVGASPYNQSFNNDTFETAREMFVANISLLPGTNLYDAQLWYNNSYYEAITTDLGGGKWNIKTSLDVPLVETTIRNYELNPWHWKLVYPGGAGSFLIQNLTTYYQNATKINAGACIGGVATKTLNFTTYNEEDLSRLLNFDFYGTFEYWLGNGSIRKNFSISNAGTNIQYICIENATLNYTSTAKIQYEKDTLVKRSYYLINATLTSSLQNISMYFLNESSSTSFVIELLDSTQLAVKNAYIYFQRYYPGTGSFKTIEMAKTDSNGKAVAHFEEETEDYKIIVVRGGEILYESQMQKVFCEGGECKLTFRTESTIPGQWQTIGDLSNFIWSLDFNENTNLWSYTYVDTSGTTKRARLWVYYQKGDAGKITICNVTDTSSAGTLVCNVTGYDGTFYAEAYIKRSPEVLVYIKTAVIDALKKVFANEGLFLATLILLVLALAGIWNPAVGIILTIVGMIGINIIGLANFGPITLIGVVVIGVLLLVELKT